MTMSGEQGSRQLPDVGDAGVLHETGPALRHSGRSDLPPATHIPIIEIRSHRGLLDLELGAVWRFRELLLNLIIRDLKVLYRQAALGIAWAVLQPVVTVTIFTVVFGMFARLPSDGVPYPVFAFAAVLPWSYFAEAVRRSAMSLLQDADLVRKVYFPRLVIPLASVVGPLVDFMIAFFVLLIVMAIYGIAPTWRIIAVPPLLLVTAALALAIGLWLGPLNVRFRDVKHTLPFLIQIWMYASPVIYPLSLIPENLRWLYGLNPMVGVIEGFRWALLGKGDTDLAVLGCAGVAIAVLLAGGLIFFKHMERFFADVI
jgi:lipopolysaccharide transport system permease protein